MTHTQEAGGEGARVDLSKATPRPWTVYEVKRRNYYPGIEGDERAVVVYGAPDDDGGVRGSSREQCIANAALIVEAVNNYDSLRRKAEALDALLEETDFQECVSVTPRTSCSCRACRFNAALKLAKESV